MLDGLFKILLLIMMLGLSVIYLGLNSWALKDPDQNPVCVAVVLFVITFVLPLILWMYMIGAFPKWQTRDITRSSQRWKTISEKF